ncbi:MAG: tRNA pseudouridine(38-40) synthase TruA [Lachnospiraceae bacterium]|nr:tRNA pseudouridine(38-40) synthase TruA [Lachnospiraceae bacterium]
MKRVLLHIAYDGTDFAGFQIQPGGIRTVEGVLNDTISDLTGETIEVIGASRTDAGVHARENIAVFDTESRIPAEKFSYALNERLPEDVRITGSMEVAEDFHPRKEACLKTYEYRILCAPFPDPLRRRDSHYTYHLLDAQKMHEAAQYLVGEHDFTSFASVYMQAASPVRTITQISVTETAQDSMAEAREIVIRVEGTGFLYNMVRIIAGTLMEVGRGKIAPSDLPDILAGRERRLAGPTAPAKGLTLVKYRYFSLTDKEGEPYNRRVRR